MKQLVFGLLALPFAQKIGWAAEKKPIPLPPGQNPVLESDPVASAVGYHRNVKDINYDMYPQRKKPDAKNQHCKSCANYTAVNDGWGKCQILTNGLVASEGWCGSWAKKLPIPLVIKP
jgi:hypothetical protein